MCGIVIPRKPSQITANPDFDQVRGGFAFKRSRNKGVKEFLFVKIGGRTIPEGPYFDTRHRLDQLLYLSRLHDGSRLPDGLHQTTIPAMAALTGKPISSSGGYCASAGLRFGILRLERRDRYSGGEDGGGCVTAPRLIGSLPSGDIIAKES